MRTLDRVTDSDRLATPRVGTSLASTYQTVTNVPEPTCVSADPRWLISLTTGLAYPARCRRNRCAHCLPINARRRALAITFSAPARMIRISLAADRGVSDPLDQARTRIKRARQALVRMGVPSGEWSWTLEVNPAGTGYHAHALQHGPYVPQAALQEACLRAGAGLPYVNAIRTRPTRTARYGMKAFGAAGYGLKTFRQLEQAGEALELNHGRVEHHSPGFFRIDGVKAGVRDVESIAVKEIWPSSADSYLVCDRKAAIYYTSPEGRAYLPRTARIDH